MTSYKLVVGEDTFRQNSTDVGWSALVEKVADRSKRYDLALGYYDTNKDWKLLTSEAEFLAALQVPSLKIYAHEGTDDNILLPTCLSSSQIAVEAECKMPETTALTSADMADLLTSQVVPGIMSAFSYKGMTMDADDATLLDEEFMLVEAEDLLENAELYERAEEKAQVEKQRVRGEELRRVRQELNEMVFKAAQELKKQNTIISEQQEELCQLHLKLAQAHEDLTSKERVAQERQVVLEKDVIELLAAKDRQAEEASKEIQLCHASMASVNQALDAALADLKVSQQTVAELEAKVTTAKAEIDFIANECVLQQATIDQLSAKIAAQEAQESRLEVEVASSQQHFSLKCIELYNLQCALEKAAMAHLEEKAALGASLAEKDNALGSSGDASRAQQAEITRMADSLAEAQAANNSLTSEAAALSEESRREVAALLALAGESDQEISVLKARIVEVDQTQELLKRDLEEIRSHSTHEVNNLLQQLQEAKEQVKESQVACDELRTSLAQTEGLVTDMKSKNVEEANRVLELVALLEDEKNRCSGLAKRLEQAESRAGELDSHLTEAVDCVARVTTLEASVCELNTNLAAAGLAQSVLERQLAQVSQDLGVAVAAKTAAETRVTKLSGQLVAAAKTISESNKERSQQRVEWMKEMMCFQSNLTKERSRIADLTALLAAKTKGDPAIELDGGASAVANAKVQELQGRIVDLEEGRAHDKVHYEAIIMGLQDALDSAQQQLSTTSTKGSSTQVAEAGPHTRGVSLESELSQTQLAEVKVEDRVAQVNAMLVAHSQEAEQQPMAHDAAQQTVQNQSVPVLDTAQLPVVLENALSSAHAASQSDSERTGVDVPLQAEFAVEEMAADARKEVEAFVNQRGVDFMDYALQVAGNISEFEHPAAVEASSTIRDDGTRFREMCGMVSDIFNDRLDDIVSELKDRVNHATSPKQQHIDKLMAKFQEQLAAEREEVNKHVDTEYEALKAKVDEDTMGFYNQASY